MNYIDGQIKKPHGQLAHSNPCKSQMKLIIKSSLKINNSELENIATTRPLRWKIFRSTDYLTKGNSIAHFFIACLLIIEHFFQKMVLNFSRNINDWNKKLIKFESCHGVAKVRVCTVLFSCVQVSHQTRSSTTYRLLSSLTTSLWRGWFRQLCLLVRPYWATNTISGDRQVNAVFWKKRQFFKLAAAEVTETKKQRKIKTWWKSLL